MGRSDRLPGDFTAKQEEYQALLAIPTADRERRGIPITKTGMAEYLGLHRDTLRRWENLEGWDWAVAQRRKGFLADLARSAVKPEAMPDVVEVNRALNAARSGVPGPPRLDVIDAELVELPFHDAENGTGASRVRQDLMVDGRLAKAFEVMGHVPTEAQAELIVQLEGLPLGYVPTELAATLEALRLAEVAGGERSGKSKTGSTYHAAKDWIDADVKQDQVLQWLVGRRYLDAREEFDYFHTIFSRLGMITDLSYPQVGPLRLVAATPGGGTVMAETISAKETHNLSRKAPDRILLCEGAMLPYASYLRCFGRLSEKRGSLLSTGTFEGSLGYYVDLWHEWQLPNPLGGKSFSLPTWTNSYVFPKGEDDPELERLRIAYQGVPGLFEERCGGIPSAPMTLVFRDFKYKGLDAHVGRVPLLDDLPVYLAVDPGFRNPYAVLAVQSVGERVRVFDEFYRPGLTTKEIVQRLKGRRWWRWVAGGAIDHQEPQEKRAWHEETGLWLRSEQVDIQAGNRRLQSFLTGVEGKPLIMFDEDNCPNAITEFGKYRYPDVRDDREGRPKPRDEFNHAIKALIYLLVSQFGYVTREKPRYHRPPVSPMARARIALGLGV